jgi:hypothetical protein
MGELIEIKFNSAAAESDEVAVLLLTLNEAVNASSTVELNCVAYGSTSAPSIEWTSIANGRTTIVTDSTSNRVIACFSLYKKVLVYSALQVTCPIEKVNRQWLSSA